VLDNKPFIVTPLLSNGNVQNYIYHHPDCDRLKILYDMSLGMVYLHSRNIVHGDLKAVSSISLLSIVSLSFKVIASEMF